LLGSEKILRERITYSAALSVWEENWRRSTSDGAPKTRKKEYKITVLTQPSLNSKISGIRRVPSRIPKPPSAAEASSNEETWSALQ